MKKILYSFDGTQCGETNFVRPDKYRALFKEMEPADGKLIPRGAGLSYCNAGFSDKTISTLLFNRILSFDSGAGTIEVESGMTIGDLISFCIENNWYFPVLPGHPAITIGGCIGFNIHGKTQHNVGNFTDHVMQLKLYHPAHGELTCSRDSNPEIFLLTLGGMGLTGYVVSATLKLQPLKGTRMGIRKIPVANLSEAVEIMEGESNADADVLYSWHDLTSTGKTFGRGIVYAERFLPVRVKTKPLHYHTLTSELRRSLRINLMRRPVISVIGKMYYWKETAGAAYKETDLSKANFPIHGKEIYFKLFGTKGLSEYQMLVPKSAWTSVVTKLKGILSSHSFPIALCSLKIFKGQQRLLHFCMDGVCLTLDVPSGYAASFFPILDQLVIENGGIANLSKDSRLTSGVVKKMYPEYDLFKQQVNNFDEKKIFGSEIGKRLDLV